MEFYFTKKMDVYTITFTRGGLSRFTREFAVEAGTRPGPKVGALKRAAIRNGEKFDDAVINYIGVRSVRA